MLPSELMKKIRLLEIRTNRLVEEITGGAYHSAFKGRGIEFDEVREYTTSDDVRDIDWNVTARMGAPYIKKYVEERELSVMLLVDISNSGSFGTGEQTKRESIAELAALLAFSAANTGDKVGLMLFSDQRELLLKPHSGRKHTLRMIREMLAFEPKHKGTDINLGLREAKQALTKRSIIFLISDFQTTDDYEKNLRVINKRHDLVAIRIQDKAELEWPIKQEVEIEDAETGQIFTFGGKRKLIDNARTDALLNYANCKEICNRSGVDLIDIISGEDPLLPLIRFFSRRSKRYSR